MTVNKVPVYPKKSQVTLARYFTVYQSVTRSSSKAVHNYFKHVSVCYSFVIYPFVLV